MHPSTLSKTRPWEVTLDDCEMLHHIPPLRRTLKDHQDANILEHCVELFISISESVFTHLRESLSCAVHPTTKMNLQKSANGRGKQEKHKLPLSGELLERRLFSCGCGEQY